LGGHTGLSLAITIGVIASIVCEAISSATDKGIASSRKDAPRNDGLRSASLRALFAKQSHPPRRGLLRRAKMLLAMTVFDRRHCERCLRSNLIRHRQGDRFVAQRCSPAPRFSAGSQ